MLEKVDLWGSPYKTTLLERSVLTAVGFTPRDRSSFTGQGLPTHGATATVGQSMYSFVSFFYSSSVVFMSAEQLTPASMLRLLIICAGDIHPNPGPRVWLCSVCNRNIPRSQYSVLCYGCNNWCHLRCSGLRRAREHNSSFVAPCCQPMQQHSATLPTPAQPTETISTRSTEPVPASTVAHRTTTSPALPVQPPTLARLAVPNPSVASTTLTAHISPRAAVSASSYSTNNAPAQTRPTSPANSELDFKVLQFNCNGIRRKLIEITDYMSRHRIPIACIQETKLTSRSTLSSSSNYNIIRLDRARNAGGGLAFILHQSVNYRLLTLPTVQDERLEC